ncbi:AraC family transcriptional regulator [Sphingobacterium detergens]|uniref:AraC family transcriptional regulator n=2 Tax=Sphingobacterium detergens TaxID=1145106 RepID=A0A420BG37_SPHD1|nr:AraC family transcriptional regulator [Sphingobacterium detergens]
MSGPKQWIPLWSILIFSQLMKTQFYTLDQVHHHYTIDTQLKSKGIFILHQTNALSQELVDNKHQFEGLVISFMLKGSMRANIHFLSHEINANDTVVILPQLTIDPQWASENAEMITVGISLDFISTFPLLREFITNDQIRWRPVIRLNTEEQTLQQEFVHFLQRYYQKGPSSKKTEVLQYLIIALITMLSEAYTGLPKSSSQSTNRTDEIIDNFYVLISKYANQQRSAKFYAEKLHITAQYLTTLLKRRTGKSIVEWIDHVVIMHAKSLLKSSSRSIKEISNELEFGNTSLFCRYFKRNTGLSPKKFRDD